MSILTPGIYDILTEDGVLTSLLASYNGIPAVFTIDPAPGNAELPYIVTAGEVVQLPFDTKTTLGRDATRDVRCYSEATGSTVVIEAIAERVRTLLHRQAVVIDGFEWLVSNVIGPIVADELDAYGRILSLRLIAQEV